MTKKELILTLNVIIIVTGLSGFVLRCNPLLAMALVMSGAKIGVWLHKFVKA